MPENALSGSQLEKLGDRLRAGPLTLADLQQLRRFLDTLEPFAEGAFSKIRDLDIEAAGLQPAQITRRNVKTIRSIVAKLRRQTTKLVQVQDLVGCRIVVPDIVDQDEWVIGLATIFPTAQVVDRRTTPQHGYRAVHLILRDGIKRFEIQLRTFIQDRWANIVEKIADRLGIEVKYGGGNQEIRAWLTEISVDIAKMEDVDKKCRVRPENWSLPGTYGMRLVPFGNASGERSASGAFIVTGGFAAVRSLTPINRFNGARRPGRKQSY